jgi:hypothetical protein
MLPDSLSCNNNEREEMTTKKQTLQVHDKQTYMRMTDIEFISTAKIIDEADLFEMLSGNTFGGTEYFYSGTPYDGQGILYMLATNNKSTAWKNPYETQKIALTCYPATEMGRLEEVVTHEQGQWYPTTNPNSQVTIDFRPSNISVQPRHYTMSYYQGGSGFYLRKWQLLGSTNGTDFEVVKEHVNDTSFDHNAQTHTFPIDCRQSYCIFRIKITGPDSNNAHYLAVRYVMSS